MDVRTLKGMTVVSLTEGTKLGHVLHPLIDLSAGRLVALQVKGDAGTFIIPLDHVQSIGSDAITVTSNQVTQAPSSGGITEGLLDLAAIEKLKVVDAAGTFVGMLTTVEIDPTNGQITRLAAHKGGFLALGGDTVLIDPRAIIRVGPELVTVNSEAAALAPAPAASA